MLRRPIAVALAVSTLALFPGCGGSEVVTYGPASAPPQPVATPYATGQAVEVEWRGTWYPATILAFEPNGLVRIHYDGWSDEWDESVDPARVRNVGSGPVDEPQGLYAPRFGEDGEAPQSNPGSREDPGGWTPTPDTELPVGLVVHVEWRGSWYLAEILSAPPYAETCRVHYPGWDAEWDEDVPRTRIRVDGVQR
ncbi:MAG: hypothetical protein H6725_21625 [Sandaracinaceae bacterium]|nr:hypothetical protein [Sandaracinaceae bacterium]